MQHIHGAAAAVERCCDGLQAAIKKATAARNKIGTRGRSAVQQRNATQLWPLERDDKTFEFSRWNRPGVRGEMPIPVIGLVNGTLACVLVALQNRFMRFH